MNSFQKLDSHILKSKPLVWIYGLHYSIPIFLILYPILFLYGYTREVDLNDSVFELMRKLGSIQSLLILPCILFIVLFFKRQITYNRKRIHHSLPYKYAGFNLVIFFLTLFGIILIPFLPQFGLTAKMLQIGWFEGVNYYARLRWFIYDGEFWRMAVAAAIWGASILQIICSVIKSHFGWGMLVIALMMPFYGICIAFLGLTGALNSGEGVPFILLMLILMVSSFIAFGDFKFEKKALSNAFGIALHAWLPYIFGAVVATGTLAFNKDMNFDSVEIIGIGIIVLIIAFFAFNEYYRKKYVDPQE